MRTTADGRADVEILLYLNTPNRLNPIFPASGNSKEKWNHHPYDRRFVMHRLKVQLSWNNRRI